MKKTAGSWYRPIKAKFKWRKKPWQLLTRACCYQSGNPIGQVLSSENIERGVSFCPETGLVLLAEKVYQAPFNVEYKLFMSFKNVVHDMGSDVALASFRSISWVMGECGISDAYLKLCNKKDEIHGLKYKRLSVSLCSSVLGQAAMSTMMSPRKQTTRHINCCQHAGPEWHSTPNRQKNLANIIWIIALHRPRHTSRMLTQLSEKSNCVDTWVSLHPASIAVPVRDVCDDYEQSCKTRPWCLWTIM